MLDKHRQIIVKNFKNEVVKVVSPPLAGEYMQYIRLLIYSDCIDGHVLIDT